MKVGIVGIGLIGGSIALSLRKNGFAEKIWGFDTNSNHQVEALRLNLIEAVKPLDTLVSDCDIIVLSIPVNHAKVMLPSILNQLDPRQTVIDCGSTKSGICASVESHPNRKCYVAAHPIAGTENNGPSAAFEGLYDGKINIICEKNLSGNDNLEVAKKLFNALKMKTLYMDAEEHDRHIAYVSHISHISSFVLGKTVLEIEKDEQNIFNMAGSGFASTVRLAKSSTSMWAPIFEQNSQYLSEALNAYIKNLIEFKVLIDEGRTEELFELMSETNEIRRVLEGIEKNKIKSANSN